MADCDQAVLIRIRLSDDPFGEESERNDNRSYVRGALGAHAATTACAVRLAERWAGRVARGSAGRSRAWHSGARECWTRRGGGMATCGHGGLGPPVPHAACPGVGSRREGGGYVRVSGTTDM